MPGFVLCINGDAIGGALRTCGSYEDFKSQVNRAVAEEMECLDWDNRTAVFLDPVDHITPLFVVGGRLEEGEVMDFGGTSAALMTIKAFDYPTRGSNAVELQELGLLTTAHADLIRPLEARLEAIGQRVKKLLGTDRKVEVEFQPQLKKQWVAV